MNLKIKNQNKQNHTSHIPLPTSNKGITLIALVITIIVMLILVAVTISMAINGGLFGYAGNATKETEQAKQEELEWANLGPNMTINQLINKYTTTSTDTTGTLNTTNPHTGTGTDVGDIYTIGTEDFYVIGSDNETVTLLAVKCLGNVTRITDEGVEESFTAQYDSPSIGEIDMVGFMLNDYVRQLGLSVQNTRCMTKDEADALSPEHADILYGTTKKLNYFLNTTEMVTDAEEGEYSGMYIWTVDGPNSRLVTQIEPGLSAIRPVVVVAITNL